MNKPSEKLLQRAYAQDASIYQEMPEQVVFPKDTLDIIAAVKEAQASGKTITPRGAGTSLAGQCVGGGIVMDTGRHMNAILEVNLEEGWVEVQPGVVRDELNHHLAPMGWFFGPNTSTSNRCMMGGMVGNNSSGSTSISYGTTREKLLGLEVVTAGGDVLKIGEIRSNAKSAIPTKVLDWEADWKTAFTSENLSQFFPDSSIHRRNTGYAIDLLANDKEHHNKWLNVLCGSEGTLAITTKIRLQLDPLPPKYVAVIAFHYHTMDAALGDTPLFMERKPYQLELMDRIILECTRESKEYAPYRSFVKGDPAAILLVECRGETEAQLDSAIEEMKATQSYELTILRGEESDKVWKLRAAGLGLLSNIPGDAKPVACIEDTAVRLDVLQEYIREFDILMKKYGQQSVYYAHAGAGELHLRPLLNLKTSEGVKLLYDISKSSAELVKKYGGSLSGEHGDGRVRAPFIKDFYGEQVYPWMVSFKEAWDPNGSLNAGKIVHAKPMIEDLRYEADREEPVIDSLLNFNPEGGFLRAVEKCNGSGDCRRLPHSGALMCPSYMASRDEWDSTRGRANVLRSVLTEQSTAGFTAPEVAEAMQHCVGCKGCTKECPSGVDMAAMKLEFLYQNRNKRTLGDVAFANFHKAEKFLALRVIINPLLQLGITKRLMGIAPERSMPALASPAYMKAYTSNFTAASAKNSPCPVVLWVDEFTAAQEPMLVGKAIDVLNALDCTPVVYYAPSGRALLSGGFLPQAKTIAENAVRGLQHILQDLGDVPILGLEASAVLSAVDEYTRLLDGSELEWVKAHKFQTIDHYLASYLTTIEAPQQKFNSYKEAILLHVHCHQKSLENAGDTAYVLQLLLGAKVNRVKSSCCGMAGGYGMKKENYEMSTKMANLVLIPNVEAFEGDYIVATGTSCRHQINDLAQRTAVHLLDVLWDQLKMDATAHH